MITQFEQYETLDTDLVKRGGNWQQKHLQAVVEYATDNTCCVAECLDEKLYF